MRPRPAVTVVLVSAVAVLGPAPAASRPARFPTSAGVGAVVHYTAPVAGPLRVVRPFVAPSGRYGPGHRGVDLAADAGATVLAAADGTVTFAGAVAGRGVVVVAHADGVRTEYEPVHADATAGRTVRRGDPLGTVTGRHAGCPGPCLHWGARRGEVYLDPMSLLRPLGPVRLLPWPRDG